MPEYLPFIAAGLDVDTIAEFYAFMLRDDSEVERHNLPGSHSLNIMLKGALDGGCTVSLRFDPFGNSAAQDTLDMPIPIPSVLLR